MRDTLDSVAVLFTHLPVSWEALGASFEGRVECADFTLWIPLASTNEFGSLSGGLKPPFESDLWVSMPDHDPWGEVLFEATPSGGQPKSALVSQVALRVCPQPEAGNGPVLASNVGPQINEWFGRAVVWMELWSSTNLTTEEGVESTTMWSIQFKDPADSFVSTWFPQERLHYFPPEDAISKVVLESAFSKATGMVHPPDAWALFLSASKSEDPRLAAIEVGTAVEVALSRAVHDRLAMLTEGARNQVIIDAGGVVGLVRILEKLDGRAHKSLVNRTMDQLASPRNQAVHAAKAPSKEVLHKAFQTAIELLTKYDPLPAP